MKQDPTGAWISADGHWRWNGEAWVPLLPGPGWPTIPLNFGEAITLPTRDREWFRKSGLQGLIGLIPILGWLQTVGWMMAYLDNLRAGDSTLPKPGFRYASRGWRVALVGFIYGLGLAIIFYGGMFGLMFGLVGTTPRPAGHGAYHPIPQTILAALFLFEGIFLFIFALLHFLIVPVILRTDRLGVLAGLNPVAAVRMALEDVKKSGATAILAFISYFIASLGTYICLVGYVFSSGYGWAMLASSVRWYEERGVQA